MSGQKTEETRDFLELDKLLMLNNFVIKSICFFKLLKARSALFVIF